MKSVCVIPARGGSKRIPHKNVKDFHGKPMIAYSVEAALHSNLFSEVIVSTDDDKIKEVATKWGARVPFHRPANLSDDHTPLAGVLEHALRYLMIEEKKMIESVCCILATAPFIEVDDLKMGAKILRESKASAVVPVTSFPFPIFRALEIDKSNTLGMVWPEHELTRSNDLPETFHDVGQFYWLRVEEFLASKRIYAKDAQALVLPRHRVQDIDTPEDWERAEFIFEALHQNAKTR